MSTAPADFRPIPVDAITVLPRIRELSAAHIEHIAKSLTDYGRVAPIIVRPADDGRYLLVAGAHRLAAAKKAGLAEIDAEVRTLDDEQAKAVEAAENLYRYELTALDRAKHLRALDEAVTPHRPRGRGGDRRSMDNVAIDLFSTLEEEVRRRIGLSGRVIRRDIALIESLDPDAVTMISGTDVADNQANLRALARLQPSQQRRVAACIADGLGFRAAMEKCGLRSATVASAEDKRQLALAAWNRWDNPTRRFVLLEAGFAEDVIDTVIPPDGRRRRA